MSRARSDDTGVSVPPGGALFENGVEDSEQLAHAGGESDLFRFAGCAQTLVELPDQRVASRRCQGGHVEDRPDGSTSSPDAALPSEGAAIAIQRRHAHQSCYLFAVQHTELWKLGQESDRQHRADSWNTPDQVLLLSPDRAVPYGPAQFLVNGLQLFLKPGDMRAYALAHGPVSYTHLTLPTN